MRTDGRKHDELRPFEFERDFTEMANTPNFNRMELKGVRADALVPVFPSLTNSLPFDILRTTPSNLSNS